MYDAQGFQNTRGPYNLKSQDKMPLTEPALPKDGQVPPNPSASSNPPPPKASSTTYNKVEMNREPISRHIYDVTKEMEKTTTTMSLMDVLLYCLR